MSVGLKSFLFETIIFWILIKEEKNLISKEGFLHMQQCNIQQWVYFIYLVEAKNKSYIRYLDVTLAYETTIDFFGKLRAFLKIDMFYWYLHYIKISWLHKRKVARIFKKLWWCGKNVCLKNPREYELTYSYLHIA